MLRLVLYLLLVAGIATGLAWLADRPGRISVEWLGYQIETSVFIGAIAFFAAGLALFLLGWLLLIVWTGPRRLFRRLEARRRRMGLDAVRRGIFAAGAGDPVAANRAAAVAKRMIPDDPLTLLLQAQAAQLIGDGIAARQSFEAMLARPDMGGLALRGLYLEAKRAGEMEAAKQFAERALLTQPGMPWSSPALFEIQAQEADWHGALRTLNLARQYRHLDREDVNRKRATVLTALARQLEDTEPLKALDYALDAHALNAAFVPPAVIAGRILAAQGNTSRAAKLLAHTWRLAPHPDIALIYLHARPGDSPRDRLARARTLAQAMPGNIESDLAVATAAIDAKEWDQARDALKKHVAGHMTSRVCLLMARIEAGQHRDAGRAREWLARAARAAPDPAWVAADGSVSREWLPMSPSGVLGAYEWRTPKTAVPRDAEDFLAEITALPASPALDVETSVVVDTASPAQDDASGAGDAAKIEAAALPVTQNAQIETPPRTAAPEHNAPQDDDRQNATRSSAHETGAQQENGTNARLTSATAPAEPPPKKAMLLTRQPDPATSDGLPPPNTPAAKKPVPALAQPSRQARLPNIFIPGPAPDDPGPREADPDELSTPLTRYRQPSY